MANKTIQQLTTEFTSLDPDDLLVAQRNSDGVTGKVKSSNAYPGGWSSLGITVSSVTNNGNRSSDVTFASTVASFLTPGMRLKLTRTVTAPTQCTSLNGTTQYYSRASASVSGMTFTDDFTCSAWVKLTSYAAGGIISRFSTSGWILRTNASGQVEIYADNGAVSRAFQSYQSLPLNKWIHVAASLDMSGVSGLIYFDGVLVPSASSGGAGTVLVQAGNLNVGATNGAAFFPGKIAQAAVFSAVLSAATIRSYMSQGLSGSETSLISAYSFNGVITDLNTTNANDLTANGSAVATNADSPFALDANGTPGGTYEWGIVTKVATTTATVQTPEGSAIPTSGGVSAVDYSTQKSPYGFPGDEGKWQIATVVTANDPKTLTGAQWNSFTSGVLNVPVGAWKIGYSSSFQLNTSVSGQIIGYVGLFGTTTNPSVNASFKSPTVLLVPYLVSGTDTIGGLTASTNVSITASEVFTLKVAFTSGSGTVTATYPYTGSYGIIYAELSLL